MSVDKGSWERKVKSVVLKKIPILRWIRSYSKEDAVSDLVAGVTISLTMIPQSIAYAALANQSPQTGLNSAFMGCFIYVFFGTIKEVVIGPTSLMALLTYEYTRDYNLDFVVLLCFLCGIVELLMGLLKLGFLVEFISAPVVSGFTTATAILIMTSQIKGIIGIRFKSKGFVDTIQRLFEGSSNTRLGDIILGVSCIAALLLLRMLKDIKVSEKKVWGKIINKLFWFLSTGRNALAVVITSYIAFYYKNTGTIPFFTTREVEKGLPSFKFPPTSTYIVTTSDNSTLTEFFGFTDMLNRLEMAVFIIPIVAVLANIAIGKAYAEDGMDGSQEMLALALCNIFGSFVQSMPTCGAFTRSAVISASGVRTPLAGLYSAGLTLLALNYLADYFYLIPRATLSAILISAVLFLVDYKIIMPLWKSSKKDFIILVMTLVFCLLFGVEVGLLAGAVAGICQLVYLWPKPKLDYNHIKKGEVSYIIVTPKMGLFFPSKSFLHSEILKISMEHDSVPIIINCLNFSGVDYTTIKSLHSLSKIFVKRNQRLAFVNVSQQFIHVWKSSSCGKLDLLSSEDLEQQLGGDGETKCTVDTDTAKVSFVKDNDRMNSQESFGLLKKEKEIQ